MCSTVLYLQDDDDGSTRLVGMRPAALGLEGVYILGFTLSKRRAELGLHV